MSSSARRSVTVLLLWASAIAAGGQESQFHADFRGEDARFHQECSSFSPKSLAGCGELLLTDHPLHIAVGSIAPQNGFGGGPALVGHWTPNESWRTSWNTDAIVSTNGSWRAGGYYKLIHTPVEKITAITTTSSQPAQSNLRVRRYTVYNIYAQAISLNKLFFFGLGPNSLQSGRSVFGMQETIAGASAILPVLPKLNLALLAELNGRFVDIRGNHNESAPSIGQLYTEATAPGLTRQPGFVQFGEGVRIEPNLFNNHLQIDYLLQFQQYVAPSDSHYSFRRFTTDFSHTIPIYRNSNSYGPKDTNGPDECAAAVGATKCPSISRNREGSVGVRLFITESIASAGSAVPFYLQPTLGGSDINGNMWLSSFNDYRFRAPNALVLRESFEHSVWGPLGFTFLADEGKVALTRGDIAFDHLAHSLSVGLTVRAGGLPELFLVYAWAGGEGSHTIANINTSLLGGSARPSLF